MDRSSVHIISGIVNCNLIICKGLLRLYYVHFVASSLSPVLGVSVQLVPSNPLKMLLFSKETASFFVDIVIAMRDPLGCIVKGKANK